MAILETAGNGSWGKDGGAPLTPRGSSLLLRTLLFLGFSAASAAAVFAIGFFFFLSSLVRTDAAQVRRADAIVALTGGAERITDAIDWLRDGKGRRLLISGVAHDVTRERLAQKVPQYRDWLQCCVDLGHAAQNTVGNAKETRHWVTTNGYRSVLVVTSSYHMPRAIIELERQLPGITLIRAPVVTEKLKAMDFWGNPGLLRTIGVEYAKFVVAYARASLTPARPIAEISSVTSQRRV
ncbi:MAG: YdcF family protein [Beijerinckiaceae bacterium]